jgi:serine/threonine protein kinase
MMGRFHCEALLYSEGLLETWRARVQGLAGFDRVFAVKCLVAGALSRRSRAAEDLLKSARAVATLKDVRVASVMDSGLAPGSAFVATEFIHGISLRALREWVHGRASEEGGRPTSWPAVVIHVAAEIAGALAAGHAAEPRLIHGALSAASVMVTPQGGIKLIDLGLFASVHTPVEIAASPVRRPCAAPELSRGQAPTAAADLYALGALIYELATGRERRASGGVDSGPSWSRALAAELQNLVRRLLSLEPAERPTAEQAEAALRESLAAVRGLDMRGELGQLVRRVMQSSGQEAESASDPEAPFSAAMDPVEQIFVDEPTQVLPVADDGAPTKLAGILRDMRDEAAEGEGTVIDGPPSQRTITPLVNTPPVGTPIYQGADDELPEIDASLDLSLDEPTTAFSADGANATIVQSGPGAMMMMMTMMEPTDVISPKLAADLRQATRLPDAAVAPDSAAAPLPFEDFSSGVAIRAGSMTPSEWRPGDLEGPTETDRAPLYEDGPAPAVAAAAPVKRWPRVLVLVVVVVALGTGAMMMTRSRGAVAPPSASAGR